MSRLAHIMPDTVTYATWAAVDSSGDPTFGSQSTAACRVEYGTYRIYMPEGEERDCQARVFTEVDIPAKARLWLPGDDTADANEGRRISKRIANSLPGGGLTLYELYL